MGSDQAATPSQQAGLEPPEYSIPVGRHGAGEVPTADQSVPSFSN